MTSNLFSFDRAEEECPRVGTCVSQALDPFRTLPPRCGGARYATAREPLIGHGMILESHGNRVVNVMSSRQMRCNRSMDSNPDDTCDQLVVDGVRSPKEELPCLLRFDWPKPIDAESGRGNGLSPSENKRPETRRSWN
ncbi:hypothetical protein TNCV_3206411 [Trichonephila clavipes]|nr:hypothetical protein TNCV_3206411 [Trichonephila clavipes]